MELITMEVLKARMRKALNESDMDVRMMAEVAGVSPATVRRYNDPSSKVSPGLLPVARVAQHYGQSLDMLVFGKPSSEVATDTSIAFRRWAEMADEHLTDEQKRIFLDYVEMVRDMGAAIITASPKK